MSLLRTAARASVATRVVGSTHRRQQQRWAQQDAAAAAATQPVAVAQAPLAPPSAAQDPMEQLRQLGQLHASGVLSDAEFEAAKAPIVARMVAGG